MQYKVQYLHSKYSKEWKQKVAQLKNTQVAVRAEGGILLFLLLFFLFKRDSVQAQNMKLM